jgi:hypothetical protein
VNVAPEDRRQLETIVSDMFGVPKSSLLRPTHNAEPTGAAADLGSKASVLKVPPFFRLAGNSGSAGCAVEGHASGPGNPRALNVPTSPMEHKLRWSSTSSRRLII